MSVALTDPRHEVRDAPGKLDRALLRLLRDARDLPFLHLTLQISLIQLPAALGLYALDAFAPQLFGWAALLYLALTFFGFVDRYILMLHCTSHRRLFKKEHEWLYPWIVWVLGPLNGETPETYYAHHVGMHHAEENLAGDLSSTMRYERDRFSHFLRYWARFFFGVLVELAAYMRRHGKRRLLRRMLFGELGFYALTAVGLFFAWRPTLVVLVVPFVVVRFLMMAGNWGQHAFLDPRDPGNPMKSAITCINCRYNRRCFNDGYHIGHHEMAARHWTDMPADFERKRTRYAEADAIVFEGIDFFMVWLFLMLKRYDWLAKHYVQLGDERRTRAEIETLLRSRTRPIVPRTEAKLSVSAAGASS